VAESNLDGSGRRPRPPGSQEVNAGELLAELVRLVDSSRLAPKRPPPPVETVSKQSLPDGKPTQSVEMKSPASSLAAPSSKPKETAVVGIQPPRAPKSDNSHSNELNGIGLAESRRFGAWTFRVSALVLAGAAAIGAIFWLESEPSEGPALIAAAQSPTPVQPPSNPSVATSSDAEASPPRDASQPAEVKAVSPEERPIDPSARASLENSQPSQDLGPTASGAAQQPAPPAGEPPAAPVNTPVLTEPAAPSAPAGSESLDSKAAPTVSPPSEPPPTATPTPSATDSGVAAHASDAPLPPVRPTPKAAVQAVGPAQRSTPKLDLPAKLSSQSGAHTIAKAGATSRGAIETPSEPPRHGPSAKPENREKTLETAQASVPPQAAPSAQSGPAAQQPAPQPNPNPVARAFGSVAGVVGAVAGLIPFAGH
jgi:hypothetical protein